MTKRNILFITEGQIDEPKFIDKILKICYPNLQYNIYSYSTTIHTLAKLVFKNNKEIDEYLNIQLLLKENEINIEQKNKLSQKYSDIILVFDFEPHCNTSEFDKVYKMLEFFNDSTNNGKLYINYPMMQSYKHIHDFSDNDFKERKVEVTRCKLYKSIVNSETFLQNIGKYTYPIIMQIIGYHLKKANYIVNNSYSIPDIDEFDRLDLKRIYIIQCNYKNNEQWIYVLNTFLFNFIEYSPKVFINKLKEFN